MSLKFFSPAKINLFLRIVNKRSDGYHNLSSLFQTISLGDDLTFESHSTDQLICTHPSVPLDRSNLILKAIELFREKTGNTTYWKVQLDKKIPIQAGLGGGSSNAATALWACNQLTGSKVPTRTLLEWAGDLGSDVAFFFSSGSAYCTGRGEHIRSLDPLPHQAVLICQPPKGLSTPEVYRQLRCSPTEIFPQPESELLRVLAGEQNYFNDLELPAFQLYPELDKIKQALLKTGYQTVLMSGSGSALFCLGHGELLNNLGLQYYSCQFINRDSGSWY